jgi:hypothetical protein
MSLSQMIKPDGSIITSKEGLLGILCLLLGAGFSYAFFLNGFASSETRARVRSSIGSLESMTGGVRYRYTSSALWQDIPSTAKKEVGIGDAVFTSNSASAKVGMEDGIEVLIQPSSMVVFSPPKKIMGSGSTERAVIQVKKGKVKLNAKSLAAAPILLELNGKTYQIPIDARTSRDGQSVVVALNENNKKPVITLESTDPVRDASPPPLEIQLQEVKVEEVKVEKSNPAKDSLESQARIAPVPASNPVVETEKNAAIRFTTTEIKKVEVPLPRSSKAEIEVMPTVEPPTELAKAPESPVPEPKRAPLPVARKIASEAPVESKSDPGIESKVEPSPDPPKVDSAVMVEEESKSLIQVNLGSSFLKYEGTDTTNGSTGVLGSSSSVRLGVDWIARVGETSQIRLGMNLQKVEISDLSSFSLQGTSQSLMGLHAAYETRILDQFDLVIEAGQRDHLLYRAISVSSIKIDKAPALYGEIGIRSRVISNSYLSGDLRGGFRIHTPINRDFYQSRMGTGFTGAFTLSQELKAMTLFAEPFYQRDAIPFQSLDYTETELGLIFGVNFRLGSFLPHPRKGSR